MCSGSELALVFVGFDESRKLAAAEQQERVAKFRAAVQHQQADRLQQEARAQATNVRRQRSRESSHLRARLAASGINTSSGSALLSLETFSGDTELEALSAINQGDARAFGHRANASELLAGGKAARQEAQLEVAGSVGKNVASIVTGGAPGMGGRGNAFRRGKPRDPSGVSQFGNGGGGNF